MDLNRSQFSASGRSIRAVRTAQVPGSFIGCPAPRKLQREPDGSVKRPSVSVDAPGGTVATGINFMH